jgi:O-6-methylguanine DNA methyltransferase
MNTKRDFEVDEAPPEDVLRLLGGEADPVFAAELRADLRGAHARATHNLHWFDMTLPIGKIRLVHDGDLVHLVTNDLGAFDELADRAIGYEPSYGESRKVVRATESVFEGKRPGSEIAYLGEVPKFQRAVLRATATIPRGEVRPYGWVARRAGSAGAVRATGTALGHNPVPFIVPCHRVVRSDWTLGEYSAGGAEVKSIVLRWEGFEPTELEPLAAEHVKFIGDKHSRTFCMPVCGGVLPRSGPDVVLFRTAGEAMAAGFEPCDHCLPA